ncbi:MAG: 5-formyltetrahydrofolate cyclo-ligase [Paenibacillaceae bacterium]|nr:5-formyltetrahydrofolate cyclo-ligase [Paenibacillaceae bacterium]
MIHDKKRLRQLALNRREQLDGEARRVKSEIICSSLITLLKKLPLDEPGNLCTYMPFGHEVNILPVAEWCWQRGLAVAVPKTIRQPRMLRLHLIGSKELLEPGLWGIPEPVEAAPVADFRRIKAVLVPGVAFDARGGRLGYGGGYYDRLFGHWRSEGVHPLKLAPAFHIQMEEAVPVEFHDERMDAVITEAARYEINWSGGLR